MSFLDSFDLIHNSQSGFRAGHSTETALLLMTERWLKALNDGKVVGSVMVDFRMAFDLVDHALLLEKLSCYKVSDNFLHLMKSYLDDRTQVVSVNNKLSDIDHIICGVPQGSILGPLLFLIFINDLPLFLKDTIFSADLYAGGGGVAQWLGVGFRTKGSLVRTPAGAHFVVALSKSHLPCLVLVEPRKRWTDNRLGQTVTRLEITLCLMC